MIWFLQNDPDVDSVTRSNRKGWGLCKNEFTDNDSRPRRLYIRSARRMVSDYVITGHHMKQSTPDTVKEPVAIACWPPDTDHARLIVKDGCAYNEGLVFGEDDWRPFGVSWNALIPKKFRMHQSNNPYLFVFQLCGVRCNPYFKHVYDPWSPCRMRCCNIC